MLLKEFRKLNGVDVIDLRIINKEGDFIDSFTTPIGKAGEYEDCEIVECSGIINKEAKITIVSTKVQKVQATIRLVFDIEVEVESELIDSHIFNKAYDLIQNSQFNTEDTTDIFLKEWK